MNKILMIEEELEIVQRVQRRLTHAGFEIISAPDGRQGFEIAKNKLPNLIITDAFIPVLSAFDLCKAIKLDETTNSIPIVVLKEKNCTDESFSLLGINDFLSKPISMDELERVVRLKLNFPKVMQTQKTKILISGKPEVLSTCEKVLAHHPQWDGYYSSNKETFLQDAIRYVPDVIFMDLLMPGMFLDEIILKLKLVPELKDTVILTYYSTSPTMHDPIAIQAQMIEIQYMKIVTEDAGAKEYLGPFNPATFLKLLDIYRKDSEV